METISLMIKPASSNCNLRCEYCFYEDEVKKRSVASYGPMSEDTLENIIKKTLEKTTVACSIVYQGGEPTLRGLDFFKKSVEFEKKYNKNNVKIQHSIQSNGCNFNKEWAIFLKENNFLVGISLDGIKHTNDRFRKDIKGQGTFYRIMDSINLLKKYKVDFNIVTVVTSQTAKNIKKIYEFYRKNNFDFLQFIPCLDPLESCGGEENYSLNPNEYGEFLNKLFDLWYEELLKGRQPYIRDFENYIAILIGYKPESCDKTGICNKQYVVEGDGSVYPCDFYVLDKYKLGNFNEDSYNQLDNKRSDIKFIEESITYQNSCRECSYFKICRGGCRRNRVFKDANEGYINYYCEAYKMFFDYSLVRMINIAETIKKR